LIDKAPPKSWGERAMKISDASGFDVLVGPSGSIPNVTPDGSGTITFAGLTGLARALATRLTGHRITMDRGRVRSPSSLNHWAPCAEQRNPMTSCCVLCRDAWQGSS
jgi:hypothetical protein